jgi:hypothetical protein
MGMTIDDCILALTKERKTALHENKQAFDMAMNVMHKYQQIEQILDDCNLEAWEILEKVKEVVEDGECK